MEFKCWKKVREMAFRKFLKITKKELEEDDEFKEMDALLEFENTKDVELLVGFEMIMKLDPEADIEFKKYNIKLDKFHEEWQNQQKNIQTEGTKSS
jgi:hypothetical protein